jgi:phosphoglycerol transferase MdoB-like AlkP superfamily enzyme
MKVLFGEKNVTLELWAMFVAFVVGYLSAIFKVGMAGDWITSMWLIAFLVIDLAYIINISLDEKNKKLAKIFHHTITMTLAVAIFVKVIMAFCQLEDLWPQFMQWGTGANIVMAIYLALRLIRGIYRHTQQVRQ